MALIFRPTTAGGIAMRPYANNLANSLPGKRGVKVRVMDGFLMRAVGDGKNVTVTVIEPPPMLGAVFYFYHRPADAWPVIWTNGGAGVAGRVWAPEKAEAPAEIPTLEARRPSNTSRLGSTLSSNAHTAVGARPAGLASSVYAGAFLRYPGVWSGVVALRCTASMNDSGAYSASFANRPRFPSPFLTANNPSRVSMISITWPFMAGDGQSGNASGIEWGAKAGLLVGHAFNSDTFTDLNHAAAFRYAVTQAEEGQPYTLTVQHMNDWKDTTVQGVVWAKNAGFAVTEADLEVDPSAADAMFLIEKRSNHREVITSYQRNSTPVECPQAPEGEWGSGTYCTAKAPEYQGNHWHAGNMHTQWQGPGGSRHVFDYETCVVTSHPDGTTTEIALSQRNSDPTDMSRENDTSYTAAFGVNTLAGEPRLLCVKVVAPLNKAPGKPKIERTIEPEMYQNSCHDNSWPPPYDGTLGGTISIPSGITVNIIDQLEAPPAVALKNLTAQEQADIRSLVLVSPGGGETTVSMSSVLPASYNQSVTYAGVTYCAYAPGLFAAAVFSKTQVEDAERGLRIMVFSATSGALIASSPVLFTRASSDTVSITCAKLGVLDPDAQGEVIKQHATLLMTITPETYRFSPYTPLSVPLYAINDLETVTQVAIAPAGTPVFPLGNLLNGQRPGSVPRVIPEPPQP